MKFFSAVVVHVSDDNQAEKWEFEDPAKALVHILSNMSDEERRKFGAALDRFACDAQQDKYHGVREVEPMAG